MKNIKCESCEQPIPPKRFELIPTTKLCTPCQSEDDVFKWKMKTVGFDGSPTIARDEKAWEKLKKQKQVRDI